MPKRIVQNVRNNPNKFGTRMWYTNKLYIIINKLYKISLFQIIKTKQYQFTDKEHNNSRKLENVIWYETKKILARNSIIFIDPFIPNPIPLVPLLKFIVLFSS